ncbi:MAG: aminomethyl transferase family protein [Clostridiales bacterium]|jgi:glycine cleavage system aminomethyltransferase T|nr:aminomethyl transferase family protein [Clostridiales bacterium]
MPYFPKSEAENVIKFNPCYPYDPFVGLYNVQFGYVMQPYTFTGWQDETMSWKKTCYIHAGLYPNPSVRIFGPDCIKLLSDCSTNSHARFPIGRTKHTILTDELGRIQAHGLTQRVAEEEVWTYSLSPWVNYAATKGNYDVRFEDHSTTDFNFQTGGPRILEVLEETTGEDLHDIKFMGHRASSINGKEVRITRMGMAGTLAYEVHGNADEAPELYRKIVEVGEKYGIRRIGWLSYSLNHTENGYPQSLAHFLDSTTEDEGIKKYLSSLGYNTDMWPGVPTLCGSSGQELSKRWRNPVELNWQNSIGFDHDFPGKAIIEQLYHHPVRKTVTLIWNAEDVMEVYASQFRKDEEPYQYMEFPYGNLHVNVKAGIMNYQDDVFDKDGNLIGSSTNRQFTNFTRDMFSLGVIDIEHTKTGTEVYVLWGDPGTRQKMIRAYVETFPLLAKSMKMNYEYDVETIPHIHSK